MYSADVEYVKCLNVWEITISGHICMIFQTGCGCSGLPRTEPGSKQHRRTFQCCESSSRGVGRSVWDRTGGQTGYKLILELDFDQLQNNKQMTNNPQAQQNNIFNVCIDTFPENRFFILGQISVRMIDKYVSLLHSWTNMDLRNLWVLMEVRPCWTRLERLVCTGTWSSPCWGRILYLSSLVIKSQRSIQVISHCFGDSQKNNLIFIKTRFSHLQLAHLMLLWWLGLWVLVTPLSMWSEICSTPPNQVSIFIYCVST